MSENVIRRVKLSYNLSTLKIYAIVLYIQRSVIFRNAWQVEAIKPATSSLLTLYFLSTFSSESSTKVSSKSLSIVSSECSTMVSSQVSSKFSSQLSTQASSAVSCRVSSEF